MLSSLPRGGEAMGFYGAKETTTPIKSCAGLSLPEAQRSHLEVMRSEAPIYQAIVEAQRNRGGPWNQYSPNYVELCNAPMPVRVVSNP